MKSFWTCLALLLAAPVSAAQDVPGARDLPGLLRFEGSWIIEYSESDAVDHRVILGRLKKIDGSLQPERQARLRGDLSVVTYQVPEDYALSTVLEHWQDQVLGNERDLLFQCQGRECGSSNFWANRVFGNPVLYGPDGEQHYEVTREVREARHHFYTLYLVRRGNKRIYVRIEEFRVPASAAQQVSPDPRAMMSLLRRERRLVLRDVHFAEGNEVPAISDEALARLAQALDTQPVLPIAIVAHAYSQPSANANLAMSRTRAQRFLDRLRPLVAAPGRLSAHGVGSLAPGGQGREPRDRIELVLP